MSRPIFPLSVFPEFCFLKLNGAGNCRTVNVLSYNRCLETKNNRILRGEVPSAEDIRAMAQADAIILPQGCRESLYFAARRACRHVFPNYDVFFAFPAKTGQAALFQKMGVPHPLTLAFPCVSHYSGVSLPFSYPFVFKFGWGGEGNNVFLIRSAAELHQCLVLAADYEQQGKRGFLVQQYIATGGRSLRVVVIGRDFYPYWRCVAGNGFYTNLARGAFIDHESFPHLQQQAVAGLRDFCGATGINLAGFDFLFADGEISPAPLFLEINFCFRCRGLGGVDMYHRYLERAVKAWLAEVNGEKRGPLTLDIAAEDAIL